MKKIIYFYLMFSLLFCVSGFAQMKTVTGKVKEYGTNDPLPGVSVIVENSTIGTVTNIDGEYMLKVPSDAQVLVFSFIGMEKIVEQINGRNLINVDLKPVNQKVGEVMVVAYGTTTRESFTGSAGNIKAETLSKRQVSDLTQSLTGQVAGVQSISTTGQPGESATVRIRGTGSMSASNRPLYVVDGVPFDGNISTINPSDIASLTVLKDASSSAIYGARGANGVVLITTKKGKSKEAIIKVDAKWGSNKRAVPNYDVMTDPAMYYETFYKALYNGQFQNGKTSDEAHTFANENLFNKDNGGLGYNVYTYPKGETLIGKDFKINPNAKLGYSDEEYYYLPDNWYDELFDKGNLRQEYNVSLSGSSSKINYYFSAGYLDDSGIIDGSGFKRYSTRLNADYQAKEWLKIGTNFGYTNYDKKAPTLQTAWGSSGNLFHVSNLMAPIYPMYVRNVDGSIKKDQNGITIYDFGTTTNQSRAFMGLSNPGITMKLDDYSQKNDAISSKYYATLNVIDGLKFTTNIGLNVSNTRILNLYNGFYGGSAINEGDVILRNKRNIGVNQQYLLNYKKSFDVHHLAILAGYEAYELTMQRSRIESKKLYNPYIAEIGNSIYSPATVDSYTYKYATEGFLARLQYDYENKYFISGSFRRDASSRFHPDNRWGNFGSIAGAWIISKESFFQNFNAKWINNLKLKLSYGIQGNDNLMYSGINVYDDYLYNMNFYPYVDQYKIESSNGEYAPSFYYKGNKDITWETSKSLNAGVEFDLFDFRLNGNIDYFRRETSDMLYYQPVPLSLGYSSMPTNVGSMVNKGVEAVLNYQLVKHHKVQVDVNFNATHYTNEVTELAPSIVKEGMKRSMRIIKVGGSLYNSYLRKYAGVDKQTGEALYYQFNENGDYELNDDGSKIITTSWDTAGKTELGCTLADVYGGFGISVTAYGFDISTSFSYQLGGKIYDWSYQQLMHSGDESGQNWHKDILNAWSDTNKNSNIPRINNIDVSSQQYSSRFLTSSNFLSLNNLTIGFTIPKKITEKIKIGSARIYFAGDNLMLLTKRKGLDPRQTLGGISGTGATTGTHIYSAIRTISGGVTLTF